MSVARQHLENDTVAARDVDVALIAIWSFAFARSLRTNQDTLKPG